MEGISLRFWHGGLFKKGNNGHLEYVGGMGRVFAVDPDQLCGFFLDELAMKCGNYSKIEGIYYALPGKSLDQGLRRVYADSEVLEMAEIGIKNRGIDLYVLHGVDKPDILDPKEVATVANPGPSPSPPKAGPKQVEKDKPSPVSGRSRPCVTRSMTSPQKEKNNAADAITTASPDAANTNKSPPSSNRHPIQKNTPPRKKLTPRRKPSAINTSAAPTTSQTVPEKTLPQNKTPTEAASPNPNTPTAAASPNHPQNKTPTEAASPNQKTPTEDEFDLYDDRPDSPIPWHILAGEIESSDSDESYQPEGESEEDLEGSGSEGLIPEPRHREVDEEFEAEFVTEGECGGSEEDTSDEELINARKNVKGFNTRLFEIATQLQQEAAEGRLGYQRNEGATPCTRNEQAEVLSEYENSSDECHSPPESEDEGVGGILRKQKKLVCITTTDFSKFQWEIGQRFASRLEFRAAVTKYAICQGRDLFFSVSSKNRNQRLGVKCKSGCPFTLYASWDNNKASFVVKSTDPEHTCHRTMENNRQLKSTWLADEFLEVFKARPHWPAAEIIETVRRAYRVLILRDKAYKVKYWAHKKLHGSMKEHYNKLVRYVEALKLASPESVFLLQTDPQVNTLPPVFQRLFLCFDGLKRGWLSGCRRVLAVDGCFLKTFLGGQLLAAIGRDGNDQMFPLAWAVVEGESNDSWEWFFLNLQQCMEAGEGAGWTVVSDEHQGILNACAKVFPAAEHRHCARHIFAHWHKDFRGDEMRDLFWRAAKAYNQADFEDTLSDMEKVNPAAAISFRRYNPQVFCRAFLNTESKCDVVTSNMAETFNGYVIQARTKHIIYMLEEIRGKLMQRIVSKRQEMEKTNTIVCPRIQARLEKEKKEAAECYVMPSSEFLFGVSCKLDSLIVNLQERSCTCRKWDLTGIPCSHAVACIFFMHREAETYVHECYLKQTYLRSYSFSIPPVEGDRHWPRIEASLLPPPIKIGPGRPRKNRRKDPHENPKKKGKLTRHGQVLSCSVCKSKSHTKRKCPDKGKEVEQQPKRPRGRPRKDGSTPTSTSQAPQIQSEVTAEPSRTGRHGRVIVSGRGSRGVGRGRGGGRAGQFATTGGAGQGRGRSGGGQRGGRGGVQATGRSNLPKGVGVIISDNGTPISNMVGSKEPTVLTNSGWLSMQQATQQSQASSSKHTSFATSLG